MIMGGLGFTDLFLFVAGLILAGLMICLIPGGNRGVLKAALCGALWGLTSWYTTPYVLSPVTDGGRSYWPIALSANPLLYLPVWISDELGAHSGLFEWSVSTGWLGLYPVSWFVLTVISAAAVVTIVFWLYRAVLTPLRNLTQHQKSG
jgi:hypothetical protein